MPKREKVSNVDTAWLHMEHPTNLMMISGVMTFEGKVDFEQLTAVLEERLLPYERFRQRAVQPTNPLSSPYWETVPNFDIRDHLYRFTPHVPDQAALQDLSSRLMSTQLDFSKPLWEYHFIENYGDGDSALFSRLHHSIGDGVALIRVLLSLADDSETAPWRLAAARANRPRRSPLAGMLRRAQKSAQAAQKLTEAVAHEGLEMIRAPEKIVDLTKLGPMASSRWPVSSSAHPIQKPPSKAASTSPKKPPGQPRFLSPRSKRSAKRRAAPSMTFCSPRWPGAYAGISSATGKR